MLAAVEILKELAVVFPQGQALLIDFSYFAEIIAWTSDSGRETYFAILSIETWSAYMALTL